MRSIAVASLLVLAAACSAGAQNQTSQQGEQRASGAQGQRGFAQLTGFDAVSLGGPYHVVVTVGGAHAVRAEGDAEAIERMEIEVDGSTLEIRARREDGMFSRRDHGQATVYVTLPALRAASIGGSGDMRIDRVEGPSFAASIGGSGSMEIAALQARETRFSIGGSGQLRAAGTTDSADVSVAGSGDLNLAGLQAQTADVSIAGSGNVQLSATGTVNGSVVGSGNVTVSGGARCSVTRIGSGDVRCGA